MIIDARHDGDLEFGANGDRSPRLHLISIIKSDRGVGQRVLEICKIALWRPVCDPDANHSYSAQVLPCHRTQRRAARRVWRMIVRATHTPLTRVLPGPQPTATWVIMSSGSGTEIGAGVRACADAVTDKGKIVTAINRIISTSLGVLLR